MPFGIGPSTGASTAKKRADVTGTEPASFRYNNPGAQYPSTEAAQFGQLGFGIIGGGHKIARFPSPVNGAAANFDLLYRNYTGMTIGAAGTKWTGAHGFGVPGYNPNETLTKAVLDDPATAIALLKAIATRESGRGNNLTEQQWRHAHRMFKIGSADAFLVELGEAEVAAVPAEGMTGAGLVRRAREHIGEEYRNIRVPKDSSDWKGPWDCAEFASWLVFQEGGFLYGCTDNEEVPSIAEAYTGAWKTDLQSRGIRVSVEEAASTVGGIVLRYPPGPGRMGHIAVCDGSGGTIEAKGKRYGVVADTVHGRRWDAGILIPGFTYDTGNMLDVATPAILYRVGAPNMSPSVITAIQIALQSRGFDPDLIDGEFGPLTRAAVLAFQEAEGLTVDGEVGPETAEALGVSLLVGKAAPPVAAVGKKPVVAAAGKIPEDTTAADARDTLLPAIIAALLGRKLMTTDQVKTGENADLMRSLMLILLQSALSGRKLDAEGALTGLLGAVAGGATGEGKPTIINTAEAQDPTTQQLLVLIDRLLAAPGKEGGEEPGKLGPVNGALGQTIGKLLNGRKSALGIVGSVATAILGSASPGSPLGEIATSIPAFTGTSGVFLPVFLGLAAWGVLGKLEKWER